MRRVWLTWLRAYRAATLRNYQANDDVVVGWVWMAALGAGTCAACWAMHGGVHGLDEAMESHPNCRCTAVPKLRPWRELGVDIPDRQPVIAAGAEEFKRLPAADQRAVLGPAAWEAYKAGAVRLEDFAGHRHSREWGRTLRRRGLREMVGRAAAGRWAEKARLLVQGGRPEREDAVWVGELGDAA